jgi:hypothetical protein
MSQVDLVMALADAYAKTQIATKWLIDNGTPDEFDMACRADDKARAALLAVVTAHADEVEALRADRDQLQRDFTYIKQRRDALLTALEKLARLGNGDRYGNSEGNAIAIAALNEGYAP